MLTRRTFLRRLAASAAVSTFVMPILNDHLHAQMTGLRYRAAAKNMFYGAATNVDELKTDAAFRQAFVQECGILTAEYEMKWDRLRPTATTYNFADADYLVNFAKQNGILVHGHTLCWHRALPAWFSGTVNRSNAEQFLREHIQSVVGRYKGQIHSWDVVNEVIEPSDNTPNKLRNSAWYQYLGENYIEIAFRAAAAADPSAMLVYNEYDVEFDDNVRKDAILGLLQRLIAKRVPIHALGVQAHVRSADAQKFNANTNGFRQFLSAVAALGLKIIITEFDCDDRSLPANTQQRDAGVAQMYGDYCAVVMNTPAVIGFITWGLSDKYSVLNTSSPRSDRQPQRPLPLDSALQWKSAWYSLEFWFNATSARPRVVTSAQAYSAQATSALLSVECAPNPASSRTVLRFTLESSSHLRFSLNDALGREIAVLADDIFSEGAHSMPFQTEHLANGSYWCIIRLSGGSNRGETTLQIVVQR